MHTSIFTPNLLCATTQRPTSMGLRALCAIALIGGLAACSSSGSLRSDIGPDGTGSGTIVGGGPGNGSGTGGGTIVGGGGTGTDSNTTGNTGANGGNNNSNNGGDTSTGQPVATGPLAPVRTTVAQTNNTVQGVTGVIGDVNAVVTKALGTATANTPLNGIAQPASGILARCPLAWRQSRLVLA